MIKYRMEPFNIEAQIGEDDTEVPILELALTSDNQILKEDILDFADEGFLLHGLVSIEECRILIEKGHEVGLKEIRGVKKSYRDNLRLMFKSPSLSEILWKRIQPYLNNIEIQDQPEKQHIHGPKYMLQGKWKPTSLNELFRLCKYHPGGHFAPHFDGCYVKNSNERSMKTLMVYLNGDFDGGSTNFIRGNQTLFMNSDGRYCAEDENVILRVKPEPGMAIVFNHHRLHEGEKLRNGEKNILRTDIMYQKCASEQLDEKREKALQIMFDAERLEAVGENLKAADLYRKAFKLDVSLEEYYNHGH